MPIDISINAAVAARFPEYRATVVVASGLSNGPSNSVTEGWLEQAERHARAAFAGQKTAEHPHLAAWHEAFKAFGFKPKKRLNSAEALIARCLKGDGLPRINRLVDAYNAVSVVHAIPCGGEDLAHVAPPVRLTFATGEEPFDVTKDGALHVEHPNPGEVVWADTQGVTCRAWNWRQGVRTRLTETTTDAYFLFDALGPVGEAELHEAAGDLEGKLRTLAPNATLERRMVPT